DKPRLNLLRLLAQRAVTYQEKLIIALALAQSGEIEMAREIYWDILADHAYTLRPYLRIQAGPVGQNQDQYLKDSAGALLLGDLVEPEYNAGFYAYLRDHQSEAQDIVLDLAQILFVQKELEKGPEEPTKFSFSSPLRSLEKEMTRGGQWVLTLAPEERSNFSFQMDAGKAEVTTSYYLGPQGLEDLESDERLSLKRKYQKAKGSGKISPGNLVRITIDFDLESQKSPRGCYQIVDLIPSGLVYLKNPGAYGLRQEGWLRQSQTDAQVLTYQFCNSPWWEKHGARQIVYYSRASAVGKYQAEPVLLQSLLDPSVFQITAQEIIEIESLEDEKI
ncbi:hypothetical protein ACFLZP_05005, partial [Patescibacteria group bacterium]